jgi:V8-like Glu-specific endopeptidase
VSQTNNTAIHHRNGICHKNGIRNRDGHLNKKISAAALCFVIFAAACAKNHESPSIDSNPETTTATTSPQAQNELNEEQNSIVRGQTLKEDDESGHSVVALIFEKADGQALCTGTILSEDTILTAAHCVDGRPRRISVIFGPTVKKAERQNTRSVDTYVQHSRWQRPTEKGRGDLALVHFQGGLPQGFKPVTLAQANVALKPGTPVKMIGYGVTNGRTETGSGTLRVAQSTVLSQYSSTEIVTDGKKSSVCFGDSGGPAFVSDKKTKTKFRLVQWGVASSVLNHSCNEASIHTSVMSYSRWFKIASEQLRATSDKVRVSLPVDPNEEIPIELSVDEIDEPNL